MSKAVDAINAADRALGPLAQRATFIGYASLLPFLVTAFALWLTPYLVNQSMAGQLMLWEMFYGAVMLSFLGGVRWGLAMLTDKNVSDYVTLNQLTNSIIPPLIGWLAIIPGGLIPGIDPNNLVRHAIMLFCFVLLMQSDKQASVDGFAPAWYGPLRQKITFFLILIFVLIMMRLINLGW